MKVSELMTRTVASCYPDSTLAEVAETMLDRDCGFVPVRDPDTDKVCGIVTDRDAFLTSYRQGKPLAEIPARDAMTQNPQTCIEEDSFEAVLEKMGRFQVRRLPVVDKDSVAIGVISMDDVVLRAVSENSPTMKQGIADTLGEICQHRAYV
jgi:CBS domain-containing protein